MENLADISDSQVPTIEQKRSINSFFPPIFLILMGNMYLLIFLLIWWNLSL